MKQCAKDQVEYSIECYQIIWQEIPTEKANKETWKPTPEFFVESTTSVVLRGSDERVLKVWVSLIPEVNQTVIDASAFRQAILLGLVKNENFNNVIVEREMLYR